MTGIEDLEKKILKKNKNKLAVVIDPLYAGFEEMQRSFSSIFSTSYGDNKITLIMEKFEREWINKDFKK